MEDPVKQQENLQRFSSRTELEFARYGFQEQFYNVFLIFDYGSFIHILFNNLGLADWRQLYVNFKRPT